MFSAAQLAPDVSLLMSSESCPKITEREKRKPLLSSFQSCGDDAGTSPPAGVSGGAPPGGDFFFYAAADGQWLFLQPLCMRALLAAHGSYEACPPQLRARLLEAEPLLQSDATRKRHKMLAHLPLTGAPWGLGDLLK